MVLELQSFRALNKLNNLHERFFWICSFITIVVPFVANLKWVRERQFFYGALPTIEILLICAALRIHSKIRRQERKRHQQIDELARTVDELKRNSALKVLLAPHPGGLCRDALLDLLVDGMRTNVGGINSELADLLPHGICVGGCGHPPVCPDGCCCANACAADCCCGGVGHR